MMERKTHSLLQRGWVVHNNKEMNKHKIVELIENTLGYTNGWRISDEDYRKHCEDIAQQIVEYSEMEVENFPILDVRISLGKPKLE